MRASVARLSPTPRTWTLLDAAGRPAGRPRPGTLGGHRVGHRVFFADAATAVAAGCRPCAVCLRDDHRDRRAGR
jgi:hypothetical protein